MNFVSREQIGLGQKALHEVYSKEEAPKCDLVDYALLDIMHETKDIRYGKAYKKRELEPSMYQILTGGYVKPQEEAEYNNQQEQLNFEDLSEEELREYQEALMRKEIAKSKWMTETRDHFRKFTDDPAENVYYIGNQMSAPKRLANTYEGHYKTTYRRDFGEEQPQNNQQQEEIEIEPEV